MARKTTATEQDRVDVAGLVLGGLARGELPADLLMQLHSFADYSFPFPGDVLHRTRCRTTRGRGCGSNDAASRNNAT